MSFWDSTIAFFWREEMPAVLLMAAALAAVLLHYRREDRKSLLNTIGFFLVCLAGQFISSLMHALHFTDAAALFHEVFLIGAGIALIRLWGLLIFRVILPLARFSPARIAEDIFVIIAYIAWFLVRLRYAGLDLGSILATSAMITAVVAFAMQDTLGNILGGLALQLDNSIEIGDWIKVDDVAGRVVDIRWRSTLVETRNWETVVIPNSQLMKNRFMVLGRRTDQPVQWRRWIWFNIALDELPAKVAEIVEKAIREADIPNVAKSPAPNCVLMEMDKGCARYALRYWLTELAADDSTDGAVRWHVQAALERAGIKLAVEENNVHLTKENDKYAETLHQREMQRRVKTLKRIELFSHLTPAELEKLAAGIRYAPFARGNIISKQGATAHWLYIIISGEAEVYVEAANGEKRTLNALSAGDFFGEMGMMTGAPRAASVVARTDVECYRVDKEMFAELMHTRPGIADEVSHALVSRRAQLDSTLHNLDGKSQHEEAHPRHGEVLETIRKFFGL